jgi:hypothetical protein
MPSPCVLTVFRCAPLPLPHFSLVGLCCARLPQSPAVHLQGPYSDIASGTAVSAGSALGTWSTSLLNQFASQYWRLVLNTTGVPFVQGVLLGEQLARVAGRYIVLCNWHLSLSRPRAGASAPSTACCCLVFSPVPPAVLKQRLVPVGR